jgi:hypothetical protein
MNPNFDYEAARNEGYSDDEINSFLKEHQASQPKINQKLLKKVPNFDYESAMQEGYSADEINDFLKEQQPKRSNLQKAGRIAGQYALGAAEMAALPYEIAVAPLAIPGGQEAMGDLFTREVLSDVYPTEAEGKATEPRELKEPINIGVRGLAEKATGLDLQPEGILEKAASWAGFIKSPNLIKSVTEIGLKPKELTKAILPTATEATRGLTTGAALEMAEEGEFGPIGTLGAMIAGDLAGAGIAGVAKGVKNLVTKPKETLARITAAFTPADKVALQKELIKDFKESGIQADVGTLTDSNLIKILQSRLAQSGLTGRALEDLRHEMTSQIKNEYKALAEGLGEAKYATSHEAGLITKESLKSIREADLSVSRKFYQNAEKALKEKSYVNPSRLVKAVEGIEKQLTPGSIKSAEQQAVLNAVNTLKRDLFDSSGGLMMANVKDLINNKIALNDIINYEVQGGAKQLLKGIVAEIDRAIISHGKDNPTFAKNYIQANKKFSEHAKTFRNRNVESMLKEHDPEKILNKMNSVQGIRDLDKILSKTPEGKKVFDSLKRIKLDKAIGDNLIDSTTQQVKLGTFSKLLEKGKNKEVFREILGKDAFARLERLQKNVGKLADTAQKFFNASKSGTTIADVAVVGKALNDMSHMLYGNPWPLAKTAGGIAGARYITKLMGDQTFLKMVEQAIIASEKENLPLLLQLGEMMVDPVKGALIQEKQQDQSSPINNAPSM